MEKQPACAAAINSSGLVPPASSKRDAKEYFPSNAPLPSFTRPLPSRRLPFHSASDFRIAMRAMLSQQRADRAPDDPREIREVVRREGERNERPVRLGQPRGARAEDERDDVVRGDGDRRGEDGDRPDDEKGPDHRIAAVRARTAREHLAGLDAIAPPLAEIGAGESAAAMKDANGIRIDDAAAAEQRLEERRVFADVADRLVEAGEGLAADEEVDQRDVGRGA